MRYGGTEKRDIMLDVRIHRATNKKLKAERGGKFRKTSITGSMHRLIPAAAEGKPTDIPLLVTLPPEEARAFTGHEDRERRVCRVPSQAVFPLPGNSASWNLCWSALYNVRGWYYRHGYVPPEVSITAAPRGHRRDHVEHDVLIDSHSRRRVSPQLTTSPAGPPGTEGPTISSTEEIAEHLGISRDTFLRRRVKLKDLGQTTQGEGNEL
jgi:hypothetical protein